MISDNEDSRLGVYVQPICSRARNRITSVADTHFDLVVDRASDFLFCVAKLSSFTQRLRTVLQERRKEVLDDAAVTDLDLGLGRHAGHQISRTSFVVTTPPTVKAVSATPHPAS
jgi:hypothetical protein